MLHPGLFYQMTMADHEGVRRSARRALTSSSDPVATPRRWPRPRVPLVALLHRFGAVRARVAP